MTYQVPTGAASAPHRTPTWTPAGGRVIAAALRIATIKGLLMVPTTLQQRGSQATAADPATATIVRNLAPMVNFIVNWVWVFVWWAEDFISAETKSGQGAFYVISVLTLRRWTLRFDPWVGVYSCFLRSITPHTSLLHTEGRHKSCIWW